MTTVRTPTGALEVRTAAVDLAAGQSASLDRDRLGGPESGSLSFEISVRPQRAFGPLGLPPALEFIVTRAGRLRCSIELRPYHGLAVSRRSHWSRFPDESTWSTLAAGLGMGIAATAIHEGRLRGRRVSSVRLRLSHAVPDQFVAVADLFGILTGTPVYLEPVGAPPTGGPDGSVFLVSGGKDTLWALERAVDAGSIAGRPAIYLFGGAELNWRAELRQVGTYAKHFGLQLFGYEIAPMVGSSSAVLPYVSRATWRELVTISLARSHGDVIHTGINLDAIARLDPAFAVGEERAHLALYLSQLKPTLDALEQTLGASIHTVPGEFRTYRDVRDHPLFSIEGSCLEPTCGAPTLCGKCRGFQVYDALIEERPLTDDQIDFVLGPAFLGDAEVVQLARRLRWAA